MNCSIGYRAAENRYYYLNLANGQIEVPFDQLVILSTNLEPKDLVDDAFRDAFDKDQADYSAPRNSASCSE